jgi:hypothetical protein
MPLRGKLAVMQETSLTRFAWLLIGAALLTSGLMVGASLLGLPHEPSGTFSLPLIDWFIVLSLALTISPVLELVKWMERRGWFGGVKLSQSPRQLCEGGNH